ncbi:MAG: universal stress protein [Chloroflexota bacterium]|nr:universal stress protein [Chloroflexota bacterium]
MGKILCATRGGEASYRTQDATIKLARERSDEILFLYVVDIEFLQRTARAVRPDVVTAEMENLGEFLLVMAQERAQKQNVTADYVLRHGDLREELTAAAGELDVALVVLGKPTGEKSAFALAGLEAFAAQIESETGTETRII